MFPGLSDAGGGAGGGGDIFEQAVCRDDEVLDGVLKECAIGTEGGKVLLGRVSGQVHAVSHKCPHYGALLKNAAFCNGRIRCQWHGACFNLVTGDIEDRPCMDALHSFPARVEDGHVVVRASRAALASARLVPQLGRRTDDPRTFLVLGAGVAGATCAEELRRHRFGGRIVLVGREPVLPYDRPKLSKIMTVKEEQVALRTHAFYEAADIELKLGVTATELHVQEKRVDLSDGTSLSFDAVCIATGGEARRLRVPGAELARVHTLRTLADARRVWDDAEGRHLVIVGASFIGMEAASCLVKRCASVTVVDANDTPFSRVLGRSVGRYLQRMHEEKGVMFRLPSSVVALKASTDGAVGGVELASGEVLRADMVLVGVGIDPATQFVQRHPQVLIAADGSLCVDKHLFTGADGVYAAGDLARFPHTLSASPVRVEHYGLSQTMGAVAAQNMLGAHVCLQNIPYFWTTHFGRNLRYAGLCTQHDDVIMEGSFEAHKFVCYYVFEKKIVACCSLASDPAVSQFAELLNKDTLPTVDQLWAHGAVPTQSIASILRLPPLPSGPLPVAV